MRIIKSQGIQRLGPQQFRVRGHEEPEYFVDLSADQQCYCKDMEHSPGRIRQCKHILSGRLVNYDPAVFQFMVDVIEQEEARKNQV